jgi:hypothetical protein
MDPVTTEVATEAAVKVVPSVIEGLTRLTEVFGKFVEKQTNGIGIGIETTIKCLVYREPQGKFQREFAKYLENIILNEVVYACQSESDGNVTFTLFYR